MAKGKKRKVRSPQHQARPGKESGMKPEPVYDDPEVKGSGKLYGKVALVTGADSGIGRAVAVLFAKEGADVAVVYLNEHGDAKETKRIIEEEYKRNCLLIAGDVRDEKFCKKAVKQVKDAFRQLDILVNNAAYQAETISLDDITPKHLYKTFETNIFSMFYFCKAALPLLKEGSCIINTASVTAYRGSAHLLDYSSTKGAIVAFTRSLSAALLEKKIRVNAVAPGPVWTPFIVSSFKPKEVATFGSDSPMKRAGQPVEIAPAYLFLATSDASFMSGQVIHPNGGEIVNG